MGNEWDLGKTLTLHLFQAFWLLSHVKQLSTQNTKFNVWNNYNTPYNSFYILPEFEPYLDCPQHILVMHVLIHDPWQSHSRAKVYSAEVLQQKFKGYMNQRLNMFTTDMILAKLSNAIQWKAEIHVHNHSLITFLSRILNWPPCRKQATVQRKKYLKSCMSRQKVVSVLYLLNILQTTLT